ncbi:MAG: hypothetical protein MJY98_05085 [Fibrobacter sp.]|nr:hypothetical protein [Fibrobacter sp.]
MKKKKLCVVLLIIAGLSLFALLVNSVDDYFFDNQEVIPVEGAVTSVDADTTLPSGFVQAGELFSESEWGEISTDEVQGITHSETHWYISTQWEIFKVRRDSLSQIDAHVHLLKFQKLLRSGWYRHFGGMVYHDGLIYVATTGRLHPLTTEKAVPIVVVLDANLEFVRYGILPPVAQKNAAWVGYNPETGHIYSSNGVQELLEYNPDFENGDTIRLIQRYKMLYSHADMTADELVNMVSQGGTFSESGLLYYVLDRKNARNDSYTGIHGFIKKDGDYYEFDVPGVNNKGEDVDFIGIKYIGDQPGDRLWEMEDLTVTKENGHEFIYHLQLHNGKHDFARVVRYRLM